MQRSDGPAIRDTIIWVAAFLVTGIGGYLTWGTWWAVPFFIAYGALYGSSTDSRWHECGHRTAFRTKWMNDVDLPGRLVHDPARAGGLALEPYAPSHRYDHRRPRSGDRRAATAEAVGNRPGLLRHHAGQGLFPEDPAPCHRPPVGGGKDVHSRVGVEQGLLDRARPSRHLRRRHRLGARDREHPAADVCRPAVALWRVALHHHRPHPARRPRRGRARSPARTAAPST